MKLKTYIVFLILCSSLVFAGTDYLSDYSFKGCKILTVLESNKDGLLLKTQFVFDSLERNISEASFTKDNISINRIFKKYSDNRLIQSLLINSSNDTTFSKYEYGPEGQIRVETFLNGKKITIESKIPRKWRKFEYFEPYGYQETKYDTCGNKIWEMIHGDGNSITDFIYNKYNNRVLIKSTKITYTTWDGGQSTKMSTTTYSYKDSKLLEEKTIDSETKYKIIKKYYYDELGRIIKVDNSQESGQMNTVINSILYKYEQ